MDKEKNVVTRKGEERRGGEERKEGGEEGEERM